MDIFDNLIENPQLLKWIYYTSEQLRLYSISYLKQNPEESDRILEFKLQFEKYLKSEDEQLSKTQKRDLAKQIIKKIEAIDKRNQDVTFIRHNLKYAAVAILCFSIGISLVYLPILSRQLNISVENLMVPTNAQEPISIIGDSQEIKLSWRKSELAYSDDKDIIIGHGKIINKKSGRKVPVINKVIILNGRYSVI